MNKDKLVDAPTVIELVKRKGLTKLRLCPHMVSNGRINNPEWLSGYDCTSYTIPEEVKNRKVVHHHKELKCDYIVWYFDEDEKYSSKIVI